MKRPTSWHGLRGQSPHRILSLSPLDKGWLDRKAPRVQSGVLDASSSSPSRRWARIALGPTDSQTAVDHAGVLTGGRGGPLDLRRRELCYTKGMDDEETCLATGGDHQYEWNADDRHGKFYACVECGASPR